MEIRKKTLALVLLAIIAATGTVTYAATTLLTQRQVTNTVTVSLPRDIQLYSDTACTTLLTTIEWGDLQRDDVIVYGSTDPAMYIKNIGEAPIDVNYTITGLPAHLTLTARKVQGTWSSWAPNAIITLAAGEKVPVEWTMTVSSDAPEQSDSFSIDVLGWKP